LFLKIFENEIWNFGRNLPLATFGSERVKDRLHNSLLQFTEMKIYSFYHQVQQRLKDICVIKKQPQEQPQKSHKQDILYKHLIDLCVLWDAFHKLFCVLWDFYASGTHDAEVTKSLPFWPGMYIFIYVSSL